MKRIVIDRTSEIRTGVINHLVEKNSPSDFDLLNG
jgi:hypothetical protein